MTRRRLFTGGAVALGGIAGAAVLLPVIGFALGPNFDEQKMPFVDVGPPSDFTPDSYVPRGITVESGVGEAGKTIAYVRKGNPAFKGETANEFVAISTRGGAIRVPLPRRRLRLRGQGGRRATGPAARPFRHPGHERAGPGRAPLQRQLRAQALLAA
jgi:hypothetical protein